MYDNGKMRHVETVPWMKGGWIKENDGGSEFNCDILRELLWVSQCNNIAIL
jgi:hypothetical protein